MRKFSSIVFSSDNGSFGNISCRFSTHALNIDLYCLLCLRSSGLMSPEENDLRFCTDRKMPLLSLTNLRKRGENNMISGRRKCTLASQGAN